MPTVTPSDGARYFSKGFNDNHGAPSLGYLYDSGVVWQPLVNGVTGGLFTGGWRPAIPSDFASTSNVSVSGLSLTVGAVALTGTNVVTLTGNTPVSIVNTAPINVTGFITTIVTGTVNSTSSNPVGVTGTKLDIAATYSGNPLAPYNLVTIGGRVVAPSGVGSVTGDYTTGQFAVLNFASNGGIFVNQGVLDSGYDSVTASVQGGNAIPVLITGGVSLVGSVLDTSSIVSATASGNNYLASISGKVNTVVPVSGSFISPDLSALLTTNNQLNSGISGLLTANLTDPAYVTGQVNTLFVGSATATNAGPSGAAPWTSMTTFAFGQALAANASRIQWGLQNIHTGINLYTNMGATAASTGAFSFILYPGQSFVNDRYRGAVQVSGGGWAAWEV